MPNATAVKSFQLSIYGDAVYFLCMQFYDLFAKYRNLTKNITSGKMVVEILLSKALAKSLKLLSEKRDKILYSSEFPRARLEGWHFLDR